MKRKIYVAILLLTIVFISGCKGANKRDDFGCWPPSCKLIPDGMGRQMCEDWKAGKNVTWYDCSFFADYPKCQKLCESEKKRLNQTGFTVPQNIPTGSSQGNYPTPPTGTPSGSSATDFIFHTRNPACVDESDYHTQIIYARPSDASDRYDAIAPKLRIWIAEGNGLVNNEAERFGMTADIKVVCINNEVSVLNVKLPKSSSEYNTHDGKTTEAIAASMKMLGYKDSKIKYIVYYDSHADGCEGGKEECSGQFSAKRQDDRLSEDNIYNMGPDYSVMYDGGFAGLTQRSHTSIDMLAPIVMLHEYTHTLGAVQSSAPHSSKDDSDTAGHCNDEPPQEKGGNDIMCRSDKPDTTVFDDACKEQGFAFHYDCNNDDYFNPKPEAGNYLATHWNLGSPLNHFFKFGVSSGTPSAQSYGNYPNPSQGYGDYAKYYPTK